MGHVLLYSPAGATTQGPRSPAKPSWDDATGLPPTRSLAHQLTETDRTRTPSPTRYSTDTYLYNHNSLPPSKEWDTTTTAQRKTKAQKEKERSDEQNKISKTQAWYEANRSQFPVREIKPKESPEKTTQKPVLKGKLVAKDTKVKTYAHDGVWELSTTEGGRVWSCCMSSQQDSRGCKCIVTDPSKRNFASIN
eukprot:Phypoly_transcript_20505.p1 GENE.Phypoly_transcript_20505~~Phypoly_transcript_20505.p1  ORF type:complete len:193 (+),score=25.64 Phypoly_transcript_20505:70-648(+)